MNAIDTIAINAAIFILEIDGVITYSRVDDDGARVVVSLPTGYLNGDPNIGYDAETEARGRKIDAALGACGLRFSDAGSEDGGEYWIFVAKA
jgi:hypothetical protein